MEAATRIFALRQGNDIFTLARLEDGNIGIFQNDVQLGAWPEADEADCLVKLTLLLGIEIHDQLPARHEEHGRRRIY